MKIAPIADIHGNLAAFEAVLAVLERERPERIVCLGDVAATGPQPHEVLSRLRELGCPVVMGNADAVLLQEHEVPPDVDDQTRKIAEIDQWAAGQLDAADRAFITSFQPTVVLSLNPATRLLCCHGSPHSFDDIMLASTPDDDLVPMLEGFAAEMVAGGHTHVRMLRAWRGREIVNPGSVGLAYQFFADGSVRVPPWADFAMLTVQNDGELDVAFRRIPYDRTATVRAMHERGMPHAAWWGEDWN